MNIRRLTSLAATLLLFNFSFSPGPAACEKHGEDFPSDVAAVAGLAHVTTPAGSHSEHVAQPVDHDHPGGEEPCEIPSRPACCQAIGSCTVSFALDGADILSTVTPARVVVVINSVTAPVSIAHPPEPPPPKA